MKPDLRLNQQTLNAALPEMPPEAESRLRHQIHRLAAQEEERPVKKKLSLGLVLALVISLLTLSALAAVLIGGKDFVESILAPKAAQNDSEIWTKAELDELKRIAEENGLPITEQLEKAFDQPDGYFKQELIHDVLRDALGFYYSTWSVEDQAWYENILVKTGLKEFTWATVPQAGDVSLKEAQDIAATYIAEAWQAEPDLMNPEIYRHHQQFQNFKEGDQEGRRWYLEFEALDLFHDSYNFTIGAHGQIVETSRRPGVDRPYAKAYDVLERYEWIYGDRGDWESETWQSFQRRVKKAMAAHGDSGLGRLLGTILRNEYALPTDDMITKEAAISAAQALPDAHQKPAKATAVLLMDEGVPVWKVTLRAAFEEGKKLPMPFLAELDARSGEVRRHRLAEDHGSMASYTLDRLMEEVEPAPVTPPPGPTRRPDGKPGFWYSDRAPEYYWKALDDYGYTKGDQGELIDSWHRDYGSDQAFWPLEAQALITLWHGLSDLNGTFPGLPAPEDITQEEARIAARKALLEEKGTGLNLDEAALDALTPQFSFFYDSQHAGSRVWQVAFVAYENGQKNVVANIVIDATSGEVIEVSGGEMGNG